MGAADDNNDDDNKKDDNDDGNDDEDDEEEEEEEVIDDDDEGDNSDFKDGGRLLFVFLSVNPLWLLSLVATPTGGFSSLCTSVNTPSSFVPPQPLPFSLEPLSTAPLLP